MKKIYFDLDGTLYGLYQIPNWLEKIKKEQRNLFKEGNFLVNYEKFLNCVHKLLKVNYSFGVITWLPKNSSPKYNKICYKEKYDWIKEYLPFVSEINICEYGVPKQKCIQKRTEKMILIDDNKKVCEKWNTKFQRQSIQVDNIFTVLDALKFIIENN